MTKGTTAMVRNCGCAELSLQKNLKLWHKKTGLSRLNDFSG
jgi:hypothetical protein